MNDAAAAQLAIALHRAIASGGSIDAAMLAARRELLAADEPSWTAAALAFQVFGDRATGAAFVPGPVREHRQEQAPLRASGRVPTA